MDANKINLIFCVKKSLYYSKIQVFVFWPVYIPLLTPVIMSAKKKLHPSETLPMSTVNRNLLVHPEEPKKPRGPLRTTKGTQKLVVFPHQETSELDDGGIDSAFHEGNLSGDEAGQSSMPLLRRVTAYLTSK